MCRANVRTKNTVSAHPGCVGLMFRTKNTFSTHPRCVGLMFRTKNTVSTHPGCVGLMFRTKYTVPTHTGCVGVMLGIKILSQHTLGVGLMFVLGGGGVYQVSRGHMSAEQIRLLTLHWPGLSGRTEGSLNPSPPPIFFDLLIDGFSPLVVFRLNFCPIDLSKQRDQMLD